MHQSLMLDWPLLILKEKKNYPEAPSTQEKHTLTHTHTHTQNNEAKTQNSDT